MTQIDEYAYVTNIADEASNHVAHAELLNGRDLPIHSWQGESQNF